MNDKVYLTFPTDSKTAHTLTAIAHMAGTTQPKLLDEICRNFIADLEQRAKEPLEKE